MADIKYYDQQGGDVPDAGLRKGPYGSVLGQISSVNEVLGTVSGVCIDYGNAPFSDVILLFPGIGASWGIVSLPMKGDTVEIVQTVQGDLYARPCLQFRYFNWAALPGNKRLRSGEIYLVSSGGSWVDINTLGQVIISDSMKETITLDPLKNLSQFSSLFTEMHSAGSTVMNFGNVKRTELTSSGLQLRDTKGTLSGVGITLPPNEWRLTVLPEQVSSPTPLKFVDIRMGDLYTDTPGLSSLITDSASPLKTPLMRTQYQNLGSIVSQEFRFDDGSFHKTSNPALPVPLQQLDESYDSTTGKYSLKQMVLAILKEVLLADPLEGTTIPLTLAVRKLVDQRILDAFNNHYHTIDSAASTLILAAGVSSSLPGAATSGPVVTPVSSSLIGILPPLPVGGTALTTAPLVLTTGNDPLSLLGLPALPIVPFYYPVTTSVVQAA